MKMHKLEEKLPLVQCPICQMSISFSGKGDYEVHPCTNRYCAMVSQGLNLHVFNELTDAQSFAEKTKNEVLRGPKQLVDFANRELKLWLVVTFEPPLDRFRLLEEEPLFKLLPKSFVETWVTGAIGGKREHLFRIYPFSYIQESGKIMVDSEVYPVTKRVGLEKVELLCNLCKLIFEKVQAKQKIEPGYPDPCDICNKQMIGQVFNYVENHKGEMRLVTSNLDSDVGLEQMENLSRTCWVGLVSASLPILVADVTTSIAVMGQVRVKSMELGEDEQRKRNVILDELGIELEVYEKLYEGSDIATFQDLEGLKSQEYWCKFRENIHQVQSLAENRYGQALSAKAHILVDIIQKGLRQINIREFSSEQDVWEKVAPRVIEMIGEFFSFRRAYVWGGTSKDQISLLVGWGNQRPTVQRISVERLSDRDIEEKILEAVGMKVDREKRGSPIVINAGESYWYVFGDRRYTNNEERTMFNAVCIDQLEKVVRSLHAEISQVAIVQGNLDNVIEMTHNLKKPVAQLTNAQVHFDAEVYGKHSIETALIFRENNYLRNACDVIYDCVTATKRKVEFEANKLRYGKDVQLILKPKRIVPILGEERSIGGEPMSFWSKAVESVNTFAGRPELSSLKVDAEVPGYFGSNEHVYIHPDELQILLDNLSDNAAKYSFEGRNVEIRLRRETREGKEGILYSISNYGNGIDESERGKIGEKFYRGMYSSTKNTKREGMGLGVYTVKRIVEHAEGAWYWKSIYRGGVNYVAGEGFNTTFLIWLPIVKKERKVH
jgi:hypothetical protein